MRHFPLVRSFSHLLAACALLAGAASPSRAVEFPAPSPAATIKQRVGLSDIEVSYSRPSVKGRQIFGALVPYGKVWRTGANAATTVTFSTPVKFGGNDVPAGTYGFYTIPGENEWTIVLSKRTDLWGAFQYDPKDDLLRVSVKPVKLPLPVETFTIGINELRDESATLQLDWENTRVPVRIEVDYEAQLVAEIEATMSGDAERKPYHQAAQYYFDHNHDIQKARAWVEQAVKDNPNAYWSLHLKAKILAKLGDKPGAVAAAKQSSELAAKNGDNSYVKSNADLLDTLN